MDRRILFFLVFSFTLLSTVIVLAICLATRQTWVATILYSLATMWVIGIVSQLSLHHLYLAIVKPIENKKFEESLKRENELHFDIDSVERISDIETGQIKKESEKRAQTENTTLDSSQNNE